MMTNYFESNRDYAAEIKELCEGQELFDQEVHREQYRDRGPSMSRQARPDPIEGKVYGNYRKPERNFGKR